jgi:hypothetical protein
MPILKKIDIMEMYDMLGERSTGAAGQCKWNEQRGVFSQSLKLFDCDLFILLFACFVGIHKSQDMNSLWGSICYGRYKQI